MSDYAAIRAVSETLRQLLTDALAEQSLMVHLDTPKEMQADNKRGISIWLYRITRNEHLLNHPPRRTAVNQIATQPIPVNLHYLITPITDDPQSEQLVLGRVLQVFNDRPILRGSDLKDALEGGDETLRVTLEMLSLEDLTRIWGALQEPYQTSLTYLVQAVNIDSDAEPKLATPVEAGETKYSQIVSSN